MWKKGMVKKASINNMGCRKRGVGKTYKKPCG
jgi:hypothetical protein